jgi:tetratricopeptide (TPR) repeat protein
MTEEQIIETKGKAFKAFKGGDYSTGFTLLRKLPFKDFFNYSKRNNLFRKAQATNYLCSEFITNDTNFDYILDSPFAIDFLEVYYDKNKTPNQDLEKRIAQEYTELFVKAIRVNQVFFDPKRINFLVHEIQLPENLKIHQKVWEIFQGYELELWNNIQTSFKQLSQYPIIGILHAVILYLERGNFKDSSQENRQTLGDCYSVFMSYLLAYRKEDIEKFQLPDSSQAFSKSLKNLDSQLISTIIKVLDLIKTREGFDKSFWKPYSFEKGIQVKELYHVIRFSYQPKDHYQWKRDGLRYSVNERLYFDPMTIHYKGDYSKPKHIEAVLEDLGIKVFYADKKEIVLDTIITPLCEITSHYFLHYDKMIESEIFRSPDWLESYSMYEEYYHTPMPPFILENPLALFKNKPDVTEDILAIYGYTNVRKMYDRFNDNYSVFTNPFIQLGDLVFCPIFLFTSCISLYSYIIPTLRNNNTKKRNSAKIIDLILKKRLQSNYWNTKIIEANDQKQGDSDIILYNKTTVLLIQVKRTSLRLDSKAAYLESIQNDQKAIQQLNDSEVFLKSKDTPFDIENRKVVKWIVSTSFEGVNQVTDGCRKVSYFEILHAIQLYDKFDTLSLEDFILFFEKDALLIDRMHDMEISLNIDGPSSYNLEYTISNTSYNYNYNKALDLNREQQHQESIMLFKECLKIEENDVLVHSAIANVYADVGDYTNAIKHFKKALILSKKDPFITRNYISVLAESENFEDARKVAAQLFEKFPMLKQEIYDYTHVNINRIQLVSMYTKNNKAN